MSKNLALSSTTLKASLNYLHVQELRESCESLGLSTKGKKLALIHRIVHFVQTGEKIEVPKYPRASCASKSSNPALAPESLMLKGLYKNDLKTRMFFLQLIGKHFHFTAFGIDWLEERWMSGLPPTYQEFARMWQDQYNFRQQNGSTPKEEWAYINFTKRFLKVNPDATGKSILKSWEAERSRNKELVDTFFSNFHTIDTPGH